MAIAVLGAVLVALTVVDNRGGTEAEAAPRPANQATGEQGDHWHASLDVYVCDQWLSTPPPEFETKAGNPDVPVGIHSHGDGLVHIHPFNSSEGGDNATLGRFMDYGGWSVSSDSFDLWDVDGTPVREKNGDACTMPDGSTKKGTLTWYVNGQRRTDDPADYKPKDRDQIALVFAPSGTKLADLGTPPNSQAVPSDLPSSSTVPGTVPQIPTSSAPPAS